MSQGALVLIIEDEKPIRRFLCAYLESQGYRILEAETGQEGLHLAASHTPELILLDLGLPDMDGLMVLERLREWCAAPIIILSARGQEQDKIQALDAGADDYLTKPFNVGELGARFRAVLRRKQQPAGDKEEPIFQSGDLTVDLAQHRVIVRDQEVHLTPIEFKLLACLVRHAGKVLTHNQLLKEVWQRGSAEQAHYLRIYVHALRHKLEKNPARPVHIRTEPGVGYRFQNPESE